MQPLTKDMVKTPQVWRMALALRGDVVDVALNSTIEDNMLIYRRFQPDDSMPPLSAFEELIYQNPLLLSDFCKIDILVDSKQFTIVPAELDEDAQADIVEALWPGKQLAVLDADIVGTGERLVMGIEQGLLSFLRRTFLEATISHPVAVLANYFWPLSQQGNTGKVYAMLAPGSMSVVGFAPDKRSPLRIACQYDTPAATDAAYYILAAAQNTGYSIDSDEFLLCGDAKLREEVTAQLRQMASFVMPVVFPSALFKAGNEALKAPFDLLLATI